MSFENLLTKNVRGAFPNVENIAKEAIKPHVLAVKITWVSNYKKFKSDTCNWTPM